MTSVLTEALFRDDAPSVELGVVALPNSTPPSKEELEALGYVIRIGGGASEAEYRADPCKHPSLNQSLAKVITRECAEDAWRMHPRGGGVVSETTSAMDESSLFDQLLTGEQDEESEKDDEDFTRILGVDVAGTAGVESVWRRAKGKPKKNGDQEFDECEYVDWEGFRIVTAKSFQTACARECRDDGAAKGLRPILREKFEKNIAVASEMRVRLELAGIDLRAGLRQVPIYWVELADDGTPVQCRGKLDMVSGLEELIDMTIYDLKAVKSLNRRAVAQQAYNLGWHIQAAAYTSGLEKITGEYGRVKYEWPLVRKGKLPAAARRGPSGQLLAIGMAEWRFAVNTWARCLKDGLFPGYELAGFEHVQAEPWMMARAEELGAQDE